MSRLKEKSIRLILFLGVIAIMFSIFSINQYGSTMFTHSVRNLSGPAKINLDNIESKLAYIERSLSNQSSYKASSDDSVAEELKKKIRILVWVMTAPQTMQSRTRFVRDSWGKRADKILYFSSKSDPEFPTIGLNVSEGRKHLMAKTFQAFHYVYENYFNDFDWFMKADDDTYVIMENLRYFLSDKNSSAPVYYGMWLKAHLKQGFYSGGAGYVLSKEALRRFATQGKDAKCKTDGETEDVDFGRCMANLGVRTSSSNDKRGRSRFHCFTPDKHIFGPYQKWYLNWNENGGMIGRKNMSDYAISYHYVYGPKQVLLDFLIYDVKLYGVRHHDLDLN